MRRSGSRPRPQPLFELLEQVHHGLAIRLERERLLAAQDRIDPNTESLVQFDPGRGAWQLRGMHLYLLYRCPFGHRASIALREKQLAFEPVFFEQGKRPTELEAAGPYAKSPTLFDGESRVWDGQVVLEYLEDRYPERPLAPHDAAGRAQMRMLDHAGGKRARVEARNRRGRDPL